MADDIDIAQERQERALEQQLAQRVQYKGESAEFCEECGDAIPQARRELIPGVQLCVSCQSVRDDKSRHFR